MSAQPKTVVAQKHIAAAHVKMQDGRTVAFGGARQIRRDILITDAGDVSLRIDCRDGQTRLIKLPVDLVPQFAGVGAAARIEQITSGHRRLEDKLNAIDALAKQIAKGQWSMRTANTTYSTSSLLARALVAVTGKPMVAVREFLSTKTHKQKMDLRQVPRVREALAAITKAPPAKPDATGLLHELETIR